MTVVFDNPSTPGLRRGFFLALCSAMKQIRYRINDEHTTRVFLVKDSTDLGSNTELREVVGHICEVQSDPGAITAITLFLHNHSKPIKFAVSVNYRPVFTIT